MFDVNGGFAGQRVTGQQRYAAAVADELVAQGVARVVTPGRPDDSVVRGWAWTQAVLAARSRGSWLLSLTPRAPVAHRRHVVTVHDLFVLTHPEWYSPRYVRLHRPLLRRHLRTAKGIVCSSPPVRDEIYSTGLVSHTTPITVAPGAPVVLPVGGDLPDGLGAEAGSRYFLSVASQEPRKNLERLIRAYGSLPVQLRRSHPLVLVGGAHSAFARVERDLETEGVRRLGYVDDATLGALYSSRAVLVSISHDEGFGMPVIESAPGGASLMLSDIPVYRWLAGDDATFVDPRSDESVRHGLLDALARPGAPRTTATQNRFDWSSSAAEVAGLMASLTGEPG